MLIFEFECAACHDQFDELARNAEAVKDVVCPSCGSRRVKKKLSTFAAKVASGGAVDNRRPGPARSGPVQNPAA